MPHCLYTGDESSVCEIADFFKAGQYNTASQCITFSSARHTSFLACRVTLAQVLMNAWRNSNLNGHKEASHSRKRCPAWCLGYSSTEISAVALFAWKVAKQQGRFSVERHKEPETKIFRMFVYLWLPCLCGVMSDGAWAPASLQHPPSPDLSSDSPCHVCWHPLD